MDAAGRKQRDGVLAEEPARRFGSVARIGVLGKQHHEAAAELGVEPGEHERQDRLRYACAVWERGGEVLEAGLAPQPLDEP